MKCDPVSGRPRITLRVTVTWFPAGSVAVMVIVLLAGRAAQPLKEPSGWTGKSCSLTSTLAPGSVLPCTWTVPWSVVAPSAGWVTVSAGGVVSRVSWKS